jgi:hypothetical protein
LFGNQPLTLRRAGRTESDTNVEDFGQVRQQGAMALNDLFLFSAYLRVAAVHLYAVGAPELLLEARRANS